MAATKNRAKFGARSPGKRRRNFSPLPRDGISLSKVSRNRSDATGKSGRHSDRPARESSWTRTENRSSIVSGIGNPPTSMLAFTGSMIPAERDSRSSVNPGPTPICPNPRTAARMDTSRSSSARSSWAFSRSSSARICSHNTNPYSKERSGKPRKKAEPQ